MTTTDHTPTPDEQRPAPDRPEGVVSRRTALRGAALGGVALPLLAACGSGDSGADAASSSSGSSSGGSGGSGGSGASVAVADVPVGGGTILTVEKVVVTQPTKGEFKAFSAICTHQGCPVGKVVDAEIVCPCHGSHFSITDGSPVAGPATKPLAARTATVRGARVTVS
jgi:Rieske Fe-S protein